MAVWSLTPTTSIAYNDDDGCQRHPDRNYFSSVTLQQRIGRPQGMIQQQSGSIRNAHTSCTHDSHASPVRQRHRMPAAAPRLPDRAKQALVHSHIVLFCPCDPMCVRACRSTLSMRSDSCARVYVRLTPASAVQMRMTIPKCSRPRCVPDA